jgi:hypothetical protein
VSGYGNLLSNQPYTLTFDQATNGNVLTVTSEVETSIFHGWWNLNFLETECDLVIDQSLNASITVRTGTGGISFETRSGVVLNSVRLETATGAQSLSWQNVIAERDITVGIGSVTGAVSIDIKQDERLRNRVELRVEVTTGAINLALDLSGDIASEVTSSTTTGSINVQGSNGFSGSSTQLQSNNYPSDSQFDITLQTTTGGINIDASFSP